MKLTYVLLSLSLSFIAVPAQATTVSDKALQVDKVAEGLGIPWGMAVLPDNTMLVTQREGKLTLVDLQSGNKTDISGVPAVKAEAKAVFWMSPYHQIIPRVAGFISLIVKMWMAKVQRHWRVPSSMAML